MSPAFRRLGTRWIASLSPVPPGDLFLGLLHLVRARRADAANDLDGWRTIEMRALPEPHLSKTQCPDDSPVNTNIRVMASTTASLGGAKSIWLWVKMGPPENRSF